VAYLFNEKDRLIPSENTLTVVKGFVGAYPRAFFAVQNHQLEDLVDRVVSLQEEEDYFELKTQYAIRRTIPDFWAFSDELIRLYSQSNRGGTA